MLYMLSMLDHSLPPSSTLLPSTTLFRSGPMVTTAALDRLRALNFGIRTLREPLVPEVLAREIARYDPADAAQVSRRIDRKSTRLNSSHGSISYAVFCLKKKKMVLFLALC